MIIGQTQHLQKTTENRFRGQTAIVTGGASGMGRAQAKRLAREGASVAIFDKDREAGASAVDEITKDGGVGHYEYADLTKPHDIERALADTRKQIGPASLLFNNAGTVLVKPYLETSESDFDFLMDVNVRSSFMVTKRVLPQMTECGHGAIVMMSSVSAYRGFSYEAIYGVSKAAIHALMMNIAIEFREQGIRCNAISPAFVRTAHATREVEDFAKLGVSWSEADLAQTQIRVCEPEEVASVALFLASDDAAFINGIAVTIDNGWMAKA